MSRRNENNFEDPLWSFIIIEQRSRLTNSFLYPLPLIRVLQKSRSRRKSCHRVAKFANEPPDLREYSPIYLFSLYFSREVFAKTGANCIRISWTELSCYDAMSYDQLPVSFCDTTLARLRNSFANRRTFWLISFICIRVVRMKTCFIVFFFPIATIFLSFYYFSCIRAQLRIVVGISDILSGLFFKKLRRRDWRTVTNEKKEEKNRTN